MVQYSVCKLTLFTYTGSSPPSLRIRSSLTEQSSPPQSRNLTVEHTLKFPKAGRKLHIIAKLTIDRRPSLRVPGFPCIYLADAIMMTGSGGGDFWRNSAFGLAPVVMLGQTFPLSEVRFSSPYCSLCQHHTERGDISPDPKPTLQAKPLTLKREWGREVRRCG